MKTNSQLIKLIRQKESRKTRIKVHKSWEVKKVRDRVLTRAKAVKD